MSKNFVYESFEDYLNYRILIESSEDTEDLMYKSISEANSPSGNKNKPWDFQFPSGKFKASDVTADQRKSLENDFLTRVVPALDDPRYLGKKLKISLEAASSKVPVKPGGALAQELKKAGYSPDNEGLCNARAKTVSDLIFDIVYKKYAPKGMDKKKFAKMSRDKVEFSGVPKPNLGPEYVPGTDNPDDPKYKENQYISALLEPIGGNINEDTIIRCNKKTNFKGGEATSANGFKGYNKTVYLAAKAGTLMNITFDPFTIPDSILFYYFGQVKLSPFAGGLGAKYAIPYTPEAEQRMKEAGNKIYTKEKIGGAEYLVQDYKRTLNEIINKGGKLVSSIESTLKSLGLPPIKEVCPDFFDANGKIEVYSNQTIEESEKEASETDVEAFKKTIELLKKGLLPESPRIEKTSHSVELTKSAAVDAVTLVAFSPVSGTSFALTTNCKNPSS